MSDAQISCTKVTPNSYLTLQTLQSGGTKNKSVMDSVLPGEYTQTAFKASVDGIYGQLHILHPMIGLEKLSRLSNYN